MKCCFTIDVEDWFHILDIPSEPKLSQWDQLPSRVEANFIRLLDIFDRHEVKATCFFLGWIAEKFPELVKRAQTAGHEIASHGYDHRLIYTMTRDEFLDDVRKSKSILENIGGQKVSGFRGSGFSVTENTPWFFEVLTEAGYEYDSTVFPAKRGHGGLPTGSLRPYRIGSIIEIPVTVSEMFGKRLCLYGGGYLRLFPLSLILRTSRRILQEGRPVVFYIHPREIDPDQPHLPMSPVRRFKSYVNIGGTAKKLDAILSAFEFVTLKEYITSHAGI